MSDNTQGDSDLSIFGDTTSSDGATEPTEDTNSEPKSKETDLAVFNKEHQIKVWSDRLEKGDKTLDDLPKNLKWLEKEVVKELEKRQKSNDIDARVEAKLAAKEKERQAREDAARFEELKAKANAMEIDPENKLLIEAKVKKLVADGLSQAKALEHALEIYEVIAKSGEIAVSELKKRMQIPTTSKSAGQDKPDVSSEDFYKQGNSKTRVEEYERIIREGGMR